MQTLRFAVGVVLLALLAVIAYDLHRVAEAMVPRATIDAAIVERAGLAGETREQRIERKAHELAAAETQVTAGGRESAAVIARAREILHKDQPADAARVTPKAR